MARADDDRGRVSARRDGATPSKRMGKGAATGQKSEWFVRRINIIMLLGSVNAVIAVVLGVVLYWWFSSHIISKVTPQIWIPTRFEVNDAAVRLIQSGRASELYAFYADDSQDPIRAFLYGSSAITKHVPLNMAEAIGWWEGGHQTGVGPVNQNGSVDVLPMGLNNRVYKEYTQTELRQLEFNIPQGVQHLLEAFGSLYGVVNDDSRWEAALAQYNKGNVVNLNVNQIRYVAQVLKHEWDLDRRFAARFPEMF